MLQAYYKHIKLYLKAHLFINKKTQPWDTS